MEPVMKIFLVFVLVFISILIPLVTLVVGINIGQIGRASCRERVS